MKVECCGARIAINSSPVNKVCVNGVETFGTVYACCHVCGASYKVDMHVILTNKSPFADKLLQYNQTSLPY